MRTPSVPSTVRVKVRKDQTISVRVALFEPDSILFGTLSDVRDGVGISKLLEVV